MKWDMDFHQLDLRQIAPLREARAVRIMGDELRIAFPAAVAAGMFPDGLLPDRPARLSRDEEVEVTFTPTDKTITYLLPGGPLAELYARAGVPGSELPAGNVSLIVKVTPEEHPQEPIVRPDPAELATKSTSCSPN